MKVLIVDDRYEDRTLLRYTLEHHGWQVTEAADGLDALDILEIERPELVITDALMPKMDGFGLLRAMKSSPVLAAIPVIFFSATYTDRQEHELALSLGAAGFLSKPLTPSDLWRQLSAIIEGLAQGTEAAPPATEEPEQLLEKYSAMVAAKLEKKVHELELVKEKWEKTFHAMNDIVTIQDKDLRITQANKAAGDCFKVTPEELTGKFCYQVFRGSEEPCPLCPVFRTAQDAKPHSEIITHTTLGKIFHVTSMPVLDQQRQVDYLIHIAHDITEQKHLEEELFQAHKMEALGTLAGGIAHDFNNILAAILGYAELSQAKIAAGELPTGYIDEVITACGRAKDLVRQILSFSRRGKQPVSPMSPYPMVKEALQLLRSSLPSTIAINERIDTSSGLIMADPTKIHQIVVNLCTNAFQAMEDQQGTLTVSLQRVSLSAADLAAHANLTPGPYLELMVQDTGQGIDTDSLPHIFEPYFTTKRAGKGTGLGLAVVYGIVNNMDGLIKVESTPGHGATFRVYFPALTEANTATASAPPPPAAEQPAPPPATGRIMVVDDEQMVLSMLSTVLERLGYTVFPFSNSLTAMAAFAGDPKGFDLLITDQTMPGLTGAELTKRVLVIRPDMPIILCTGYSSIISEEQAKAIGIKRYLNKPMELQKLTTAIREVMHQ